MRKQMIVGMVAVIGLITCILYLHMPTEALAHDWQAPAEASKIVNPVAMNEASIISGRKTYWKKCLMCHGPKAQGKGLAARSIDPKPANLIESLKMHNDGDIHWKIMNGRLPMPGFKAQLKDQQVWDIINFIKSLKK